MNAPELTDAEAATVARFEATPAAPESFDPIAALRRVAALAEEWGADVDARYSSARIAKSTAARVLRAALASQADR